MEVEIAQTRNSPDIDEMCRPSLKSSKHETPLRKVICRYGPGCTHMLDVAHREKFWHPKSYKVNGTEQITAIGIVYIAYLKITMPCL